MRDLDELFATFEVEVSTRIDAPAERVWEIVTDVGRIQELSPEVVDAHWLDGDGLKVGSRFAGTNRLGEFEWERVCTVEEVDPFVRFAYVVGDRFDGSPSARWVFELDRDGDGTYVTERFVHLPQGRSGTRLLAEQAPERADEVIDARREVIESGIHSTLAALKRISEKG